MSRFDEAARKAQEGQVPEARPAPITRDEVRRFQAALDAVGREVVNYLAKSGKRLPVTLSGSQGWHALGHFGFQADGSFVLTQWIIDRSGFRSRGKPSYLKVRSLRSEDISRSGNALRVRIDSVQHDADLVDRYVEMRRDELVTGEISSFDPRAQNALGGVTSFEEHLGENVVKFRAIRMSRR